MTFIERLEKKFPFLAISNLTIGIIIMQVIVYVASLSVRGIEGTIVFEPQAVYAGEWWRIITFLFMPPFAHPFIMLFTWYFFYFLGTSLETTWGEFRYTLFIAVGWLATVSLALVVPILDPELMVASHISNSFLMTTVFLAFAHLNPDYQILFMFILPVKVKWLAWLTLVGFVVFFIFGDLVTKLATMASLLNYLLFFARDNYLLLRYGCRCVKQKSEKIITNETPVNCCAICGATEISNPEKEFRFCSKCKGRMCYCMEHLHEHQHKQ